ncbi:MAG: phosphodiester glycosidase family protein [Oscillatoria sp. SIO1A7]|nr:phosphodiester glycosidase family protein [Oscillatoria sp. SIO1A7]
MQTSSKFPSNQKLGRRSFLFLAGTVAAKGLAIAKRASAAPVQIKKTQAAGANFYQTTIDLADSETLMAIGLANNASQANSNRVQNGDEPFDSMVARYPAAVIANGTFFSKDAQKRVMGNMVSEGRFLKYSQWENFGTTLGLRSGNRPEMITARVDGKPEWREHWFSLTCGPRLMKGGEIWLDPEVEGFKDPNVLGASYRSATGFTADGQKLFIITFLSILTLQQEAEVMKALGCHEAMNLDGGASIALASNGEIILPPERNLTNVILAYDAAHPAPSSVKAAWQRFQNGYRPQAPQ